MPALASVGVHYRPWQVVEHLRYPTPFAALATQLQLLLDDSDKVTRHLDARHVLVRAGLLNSGRVGLLASLRYQQSPRRTPQHRQACRYVQMDLHGQHPNAQRAKMEDLVRGDRHVDR